MTTYYEYMGSKGKQPEVELDVIDWQPSIEVKARTFESREDLEAYVAEEIAK